MALSRRSAAADGEWPCTIVASSIKYATTMRTSALWSAAVNVAVVSAVKNGVGGSLATVTYDPRTR